MNLINKVRLSLDQRLRELERAIGKVALPEVFSPPADAHQVLGGDLAAVGLLVQAGEWLQRVKNHLGTILM